MANIKQIQLPGGTTYDIEDSTARGDIASKTLQSLSDVAISSPTNGQSLMYNGTSWVNGSGAGTGDMQSATYDPNGNVATAGGIPNYVAAHSSGSLSDLSDTNISTASLSDDDSLTYDSTSSKWVNEPRMKTDGSNASSNVTFSGKFNTEDDISLANENLLVKSYTISSGIPLTQISPTLVSFVETPTYFNSLNFTNVITGNLSLYRYVTSSGEVKLMITNPNGISFNGGTSLQPGARYSSNVSPSYYNENIYYVDMIISEQSYLAAIVESNQTIDVSLNISGSYNQVSLDVNLQFHIDISHDYLDVIWDSGTYSLYNASSSSIPAATVNQAFIEILASWNDSSYNKLFAFTSEFYGVDSSYENKGVSAFQGYAKGTRSFAFGSGRDTVAIEYGEHSGDTGILYSTIAGETNQVALGKYNANKSTTLFEVGNGTGAAARSNAFEVYNDGTLSTDNGATKHKLGVLQINPTDNTFKTTPGAIWIEG